MLLLVTDTSGKDGFVGLVRTSESAPQEKPELVEEVPLAGGTFSAQLVPQISALLAKHGFSKADIGAFIVVSGPGSFTGLRVGLAAIKALAEILQKPIVPVSLLEVLAVACVQGKVTAVLDAGRGEVYAGEYESSAAVREFLLTKAEFFSAVRDSTIATADEALAGAARNAGVSVSEVSPPNAQTVGALGWRKIQRGETVTPEQLEANYIRRSDAEIFAVNKP